MVSFNPTKTESKTRKNKLSRDLIKQKFNCDVVTEINREKGYPNKNYFFLTLLDIALDFFTIVMMMITISILLIYFFTFSWQQQLGFSSKRNNQNHKHKDKLTLEEGNLRNKSSVESVKLMSVSLLSSTYSVEGL